MPCSFIFFWLLFEVDIQRLAQESHGHIAEKPFHLSQGTGYYCTHVNMAEYGIQSISK